jgi:hypothetical protein
MDLLLGYFYLTHCCNAWKIFWARISSGPRPWGVSFETCRKVQPDTGHYLQGLVWDSNTKCCPQFAWGIQIIANPYAITGTSALQYSPSQASGIRIPFQSCLRAVHYPWSFELLNPWTSSSFFFFFFERKWKKIFIFLNKFFFNKEDARPLLKKMKEDSLQGRNKPHTLGKFLIFTL